MKNLLMFLLLGICQGIFSQSISKYEYWFDQQSGDRVSGTATGNDISLMVDVSSLAQGVHAFNFRAQDSEGNWSAPASSFFLKFPNTNTNVIKKCEYWIDKNTDGKQTINANNGVVALDIDVKNLAKGVHHLTLRTQDSNGQWSSPTTHIFVVPENTVADNKIVAYQYWFNDSKENTRTVDVTPQSPFVLDTELSVTNVRKNLTLEDIEWIENNGEKVMMSKNVLNTKFKDSNGYWSTLQTDTFYVHVDISDLDPTVFIKNPDASDEQEGWTFSDNSYHYVDNYMHWSGEYNPYFVLESSNDGDNPTTMSQTIEGLPAGAYSLSFAYSAAMDAKLTLSVNGYSAEIPSYGQTGGEIWEDALPNSKEKQVNGGRGAGWGWSNQFFTTDGSPITIKFSVQNNNYGSPVWIDDLKLSIISETSNVSIIVKDADGTDITNKATVTWYDVDGKQIGTGKNLSGIEKGTELYYSVTLGEELGRVYREVNMRKADYIEQNVIACQLEKIGRVLLEGRVSAADIDKTTATVSVRQMLNGKYEQDYSTQTDKQGLFRVEVYDDVTDITISGDGYLDATLHRDGFGGSGNVGTVPVSLLTGYAITANISMEKAMATGEAAETTAWTDGLTNIDFTLTNQTKGTVLSDITVQGSSVIIKSGAAVGDRINLTAVSKQGVFADATTTFTINEGANDFDLLLTELGGIDATYTATGNGTTVGYLYDNNDVLAAQGSYKGETLSLRHLKNGSYTLVSMGQSLLFGSMTRLSDLSAIGLSEGTDYVTTRIEVVDGELTAASISDVPRLDETPFYYTTGNTYFNASKASVMSGDYLTLSAHIDFKPENADKANGVTLTIDLPEGCRMLENSVIANRQAVPHTVNGSHLTMTLTKEQYESEVRFCVIPTINQSYTVTAVAAFDIDRQVQQAIGTAQFEAKGLSLSAPELTHNTTVTINGTAKGHSEVKIYDNDVLVGTTTSKADGSWTAQCELFKPYSHSFHDIYAKITADDGLELTSETKQVEYDKNLIVPTSVMMTYYNGWYGQNFDVTFDLLNGTASQSSYPFYTETDFTFLADFTNNDPSRINNVNIKVLNSDGTVRTLPATFDSKQGKWVATSKYYANRLPKNVTVEYTLSATDSFDDTERSNDEYINIENVFADLESYIDDNFDYEVLADEDNFTQFRIYDNKTKMYHSMSVELLNPSEQNIDEYVYVEDSENNINFYLKENMDGNSFEAAIIEEGLNSAYRIKFDLQTSSNARLLRKRVSISEVGEFAANAFIPFYEYSNGVIDYNFWKKKLQKDDEEIENERNKTFNLLMATCPDGKRKLTSEWISAFSKTYMELVTEHGLFTNNGYDLLEIWRKELLKQFAFEAATLGLRKYLKIIPNIKIYKVNSKNARYWQYLVKGGKKKRVYYENMIEKRIEKYGEVMEDIFVDGSISERFSSWEPNRKGYLIHQFANLQSDIKSKYQKCDKDPEENNDEPTDDKSGYNGKGVTPILDPSGFVYEAVLSNRLQGVTTTCYEQQGGSAVMWNADDYSQQNPLTTDETGFYRWDVPQGMWQVKYEKEGYETVYSEWLPVPPPQLDVNISMKQSTPPTVKQMRGYESGIVIDMSKYMLPATMTTQNITVTRNGMTEKGTIELVDMEESPLGGESYVSKIKFVPSGNFNSSDVVVVTVHKEVESYCGVSMVSDHVETVKIEPEIKSIVADEEYTVPYQGEREVSIVVLPKEASANKTLHISTSSEMIASISATDVKIKQDGTATFTVGGELPGGAVLDFSIDGTDATGTSKVKVTMGRELTASPTASIRNGETITSGTMLTLSCDTEGATIYYTLDGSCPCDEATRILYDGPIAIASDVVVKAMAVSNDLDDSDVTTFVYMVTGIHGTKANADIRVKSQGKTITITGAEGANCHVFDAQGRDLASRSHLANEAEMEVSATGVCLVSLRLKNGQTCVYKVIVR